MTRIECLIMAFARMNGFLDPDSDSFKNRNPMLLRAFQPKHARCEKGYRVFSSIPAGIDNSIIDLKIKCSGQSHSKLSPDSTLTELVCVYGNPISAVKYIVNFLKRALKDENVTDHTKLSWILEPTDVTNKVEEACQIQLQTIQ